MVTIDLPAFPAGWAAGDGRMHGGSTWKKAAIQGFFSREDEDPLDVCPPGSGRSVEF
jgi:hypothetical protein